MTHGWSGKGAGDDFCNTCQCNDGALACTKKACDKCSLVKCGSGTTCKDGQCVNTKKETCTNGKTTVDHGWSGAGDGDNACNKCSCNSGQLICSKMMCERKPKSCKDGDKVVEHGWTGKKACNTCACNEGTLQCTQMLCDACALIRCKEGAS